MPPPSADDVRNLLRAVIDPELGANIVDLGMATDVAVSADGVVAIGVKLTIRAARFVHRSKTTSNRASKLIRASQK